MVGVCDLAWVLLVEAGEFAEEVHDLLLRRWWVCGGLRRVFAWRGWWDIWESVRK